MDSLHQNEEYVTDGLVLGLPAHEDGTTQNYICSDCNENFSNMKELNDHTSTTHNSSVRHLCSVCDKYFLHKKNLRSHIRKVHQKNANFKCSDCHLKFLSILSLKSHTEKVHIKKQHSVCEPTIENNVTTTRKVYKRHHCKECSATFSQKQHYTHHINSVHLKLRPFNCSECNIFFSSCANLKRHVSRLHQKLEPIKCKHCLNEVTFCDKAAFNRHYEASHMSKIDEVTQEVLKKYRCSECVKSFAWRKSLKNHINTFHMKIRPYHCDDCNTSFSQKGHYTHHMKAVHLKIKPFNCKECELYFSTRVSLTRHIAMMHQKLHPIKCKHCSNEVTFCDKAAFNRHYDFAHRQKLYSCKICDKDFVNKKSLCNHDKRYHESSSKPVAKSDNDGADYSIITEGYTAPLVILNEEIEMEIDGVYKVNENSHKEQEDFLNGERKDDCTKNENHQGNDHLEELPIQRNEISSLPVKRRKESNENNKMVTLVTNDNITDRTNKDEPMKVASKKVVKENDVNEKLHESELKSGLEISKTKT